jgi:tetratricopeptide (TPR) repeat protein
VPSDRRTYFRLVVLAVGACAALLAIATLAMATAGPGAAILVGVVGVVGAIATYLLWRLLDEMWHQLRRPNPMPPAIWHGRLAKAPLSVMGVAAVPSERAGEGKFDSYRARDLDETLRMAIAESRFVVVRGPSLAGKSRTALEAARAVLSHADVVVPDADLARSLTPLSALSSRRETVIWLDDINRFLRPTGSGVNSGLSLLAIDQFLIDKKRLRIVATIRTDAWDEFRRLALSGASVSEGGPITESGISRLPWEILQRARRLDLLGPITESERARTAADDWGALPPGSSIGEFLVGIPVLADRLLSASPWETSLISAAADWQRMWAGESLNAADVRAMWAAWMSEAGNPATDALFEKALQFAIRPFANDRFAFVNETTPGHYRITDYWLARRIHEHGGSIADIPASVWRVAIDRSAPDAMVRMGYRAAIEPSPGIALGAWDRALSASGDDPSRAEAAFNLLLGYRTLGLVDQAIQSGERLWEFVRSADDGQLSLTVARGLFNVALLYKLSDRRVETRRTVERLHQTLGRSINLDVREVIGRALLLLQTDQSEAHDREPAIKTGQMVWDSFGADQSVAMQRALAQSAVVMARDQRDSGDGPGAIATAEKAVAQLERSIDPAVVDRVDDLLFHLAVDEKAAGDADAAIRAGLHLVERYPAEDASPAVLATALHNLAAAYADKGDFPSAIATGRSLVARFEAASDPSLLRLVVVAKQVIAKHHHDQGLWGEAIETGEAVWAVYQASADPLIHEIVAGTLVTLAESYEEMGQVESAVEVGNRLLAAVSPDEDSAAQIPVANGLVNHAVHLAKFGRVADALEVEDRLWKRYGRATDPEIQHLVAASLRNQALHHRLQGDLVGAVETGERLWQTFRRSKDDRVRRWVLLGTVNLAEDYASLGRTAKAIQVGKRLWTKPLLAQTAYWPALSRGIDTLATQLADNGDVPAAIDWLNRLVDQLTAAPPAVEERPRAYFTARCLRRLEALYQQQGNSEAALAVGQRLDLEFRETTDPDVRAEVASGLAQTVEILASGDPASAIDQAERLCAEFGEDESPSVSHDVGRVLVGLVRLYGQAGDTDRARESLKRLRTVAARCGDNPSRSLLGHGLVSMAAAYELAGDVPHAIDIGQEVLEYRSTEDPVLSELAAEVERAMSIWREQT